MQRICVLSAVLCCIQSVHGGSASFVGLGDFPGGAFQSRALNVSPDGSIVVGWSTSEAGNEAFRWTQGSGLQGMGILPPNPSYSASYAISTDGSTIVGENGNSLGSHAFRWRAGSGMSLLEQSSNLSSGRGTTADGEVIVGGRLSGNWDAFRWTQSAGMVSLGDLPGGTNDSFAEGVSDSGEVIVGWGTSTLPREAFRWTLNNGMVGLGDLPGGSNISEAFNVSSNGEWVVGDSSSANGVEGFRWDAQGGMIPLGDLPGGDPVSTALDVTADGSIVVGSSSSALGQEAFFWDSAHGMRSLYSVLTVEFGLNLDGWYLSTANAISDNGTVIVGNARNPAGQVEAFRAVIPEPSTTALIVFAVLPLVARRRVWQN